MTNNVKALGIAGSAATIATAVAGTSFAPFLAMGLGVTGIIWGVNKLIKDNKKVTLDLASVIRIDMKTKYIL